MSHNNVQDEILSPRSVDDPDSARKRIRLENSSWPSWSLSDKKTDQDVLQEMGVSLLEPDELDPECDMDTSATTAALVSSNCVKSGSKRKHDLENVNPNVNSAGKGRNPKHSPKGKLCSSSLNPSPGPSLLSPGSEFTKPDDILPHWADEETPEGQLTRTDRRLHQRKALAEVHERSSPERQTSLIIASSVQDSFSLLSDEVLLGIFKWLPKRTLAHCMLVCKRWHRVASDETFWQRLELGNRNIATGALGRILARKPVIVRLAGSEIGEWHPPSPEMCRIQYLDLSMCGVDRATLTCLLRVCSLVKLSVEALELDDEVCTAIGRSTKMESLNLTMASGITPEGLTAILDGCSSLVSLNISWCNLSAPSLEVLSSRAPRTLQRLNCAGARLLTDDTLYSLVRCLPRLRELDVSDCARLTGGSLRALHELPSLQHLALSRLYLLPSGMLTKIGSLPSLQYLEVWGLLQDASLSALRAAMPHIQLNQFMHSAIARPTVGQRRTSIWGLRTRD